MTKVSILILTSSFPRWPNDTDPPFVYQLAQRLSETFDITVLAPHCPGARRFEKFDHLKVVRFKYFIEKYQKLAYQGGILGNLKQNQLLYFQIPFFFLFEFIALVRLIANLKPSLVHAHWIIPQGLIAAIACCLFRLPPRLLCTAHGADVYGLGNPLSTFLRRFVIRKADATTAVSKAMKEDLIRDSGDQCHIDVISMGVDLQSRFVPGDNERKRHQLLFVGRLVEKKGAKYLLEAMPRIRQSIPDISLLIVGDGPEKKHLLCYTNANGLEDCVRFQGAIPNAKLVTYYQTSELLVFPSVIAERGDREGLGLVLVEAMGCRCGVIATNLDAVRDVVQDGHNGVVVPQGSPEAIAASVIALLRNRPLLEVYQQNGRRSVCEKFDWTVIVQKYIETYRTLIHRSFP